MAEGNGGKQRPSEDLTERLLVETDVSNKEDVSESEGSALEAESSRNPVQVKDRFYLVYICMLLTGAGVLFPWNSLVVGIDYFQFLYPTKRPEIAIPVTYLIVTLASILFNINTLKLFPMHGRIGFGYIMFCLALLFLILLDIGVNNCIVDTEVGFYLTLLATVVVALGSGVQQSSYYGLAGMMPGRNTQAVMMGESVAGIVVSINRIVTKAATNSLRIGAIAFFAISLLYILFCVLCQIFLRFSPFVQYHVRQCNLDRSQTAASEQNARSHEETSASDEGGNELAELVSEEFHQVHLTWKEKLTRTLHIQVSAIRRVWVLVVTVYVVFFITLSVFPGISSEVQYCVVGDWMPIILITTFNLSDCISRFLALLPNPWKPFHLLIMSLCRIVLVPLLVLCVSPSPLYPIFPAPAIPIFLVMVVGLTTGYLGTLAMITAPASAQEEHKELTGTIMTFFLLAGLATGSVFAYTLVPLTQLTETRMCSANATAEFYCTQQSNNSLARFINLDF